MYFGELIGNLRKQNDLSIRELATILDLDVVRLSRIERCCEHPKFFEFEKLFSYFGKTKKIEKKLLELINKKNIKKEAVEYEKKFKIDLEEIKEHMDENGLTGEAFANGVFVNANYSADGKLFVFDGEIKYRVEKDHVLIPEEEIITCYYCDKPAVTVDHCYPYQQENTTCKEHKHLHV